LKKAKETKYPNTTDTQAIQEHIKKQNEIRLEKAKTKQLLISNLKLSEIDVKSPLDKAIAAKTVLNRKSIKNK
jgi:hypothetical protein